MADLRGGAAIRGTVVTIVLPAATNANRLPPHAYPIMTFQLSQGDLYAFISMGSPARDGHAPASRARVKTRRGAGQSGLCRHLRLGAQRLPGPERPARAAVGDGPRVRRRAGWPGRIRTESAPGAGHRAARDG